MKIYEWKVHLYFSFSFLVLIVLNTGKWVVEFLYSVNFEVYRN